MRTVKKIVRPQSDIWQWTTDQSGIVRMGFSYKPNGINIYYRSDEETRFKLISKLRENDKDEEIEDSLLKKAGIALETKVYAAEGHGFSKKENEQDWYDRLEAFLNKHNPAN